VKIWPTISVRDIGVDTNVYHDSGTDPVKDFAFTVIPDFTTTLGGRRANLTLRSTTQFVYFATQASERSVNPELSVSGSVALKRVVPVGEVGYLNTRERINEEIDARARRVERRGAAGVDVAVTPKIAARARGELLQMRFDADAKFDDHWLAEQLNRNEHALSAGARFVLTPLTAVVFSAKASRIRFIHEPLRDTDTRQLEGGVELHTRALISGSARIGYQRFRPLNPALPDFSGIVGAGNLTYRFSPVSSLAFGFDRMVEFSYLEDEPYYVREAYSLAFRRQLSQRWDLTVSGERSWHQYWQSGVNPGNPASSHTDRLLGGTLSIGYLPGRRTQVTTSMSYQNRQSELDDRSYDGLVVGTSVAYAF
jgi:hypothetical protein